METKKHPFIEYLEELRAREDRGALAALRRGLGQPAGTVASMYRYVVPWLPAGSSGWQERDYYLIASLFASHPKGDGNGTMGRHFADALRRDEDATAIERRFTALLAAHPDDVDSYLRQAVSFMRSRDVPVDWHQLFADVRRWHYDDRRVQRAWARDFWGRPNDDETANADKTGREPGHEPTINEEE